MDFLEAVTLGVKQTGPCLYDLISLDGVKRPRLYTCLLGAAYVGVKGRPALSDDAVGKLNSRTSYQELRNTFPVLRRKVRLRCDLPSCSSFTGAYSPVGLCIHLNDDHELPRLTAAKRFLAIVEAQP